MWIAVGDITYVILYIHFLIVAKDISLFNNLLLIRVLLAMYCKFGFGIVIFSCYRSSV